MQVLAWLCLTVCAACDASGRDAGTPASIAQPPPNIILVTIDTLRADALSESGTPYLHQLAKAGTRYSRAYSTAPWTAPALASLLTGTYPLRHGVRTGAERHGAVTYQPALSPELPFLPELLKRAGYRTIGFSANHHSAASFGFGRGFDTYVCAGFWDGELVEHFFTPVRDEILANPQRPFFLWLHVFDPHQSYHAREPWISKLWPAPKPRFDELSAAMGPAPLRAAHLDAPRVDYLKALYASEVSYTDALLRRLLEPLDAGSETTALIVTSDHGEEFADHGGFGHAHTVFEELIHVPLIVRAPGYVAGREISSVVSLVDILPTVVGIAGQEKPTDVPGRILPFDEVPSDRRAVFASNDRGVHLRAVIQGTRKVVRRMGRGGFTRAYDLASDPRENHGLSVTDTAAPAQLDLQLDRLLGGHLRRSELHPRPRPPQAALSNEELQRLRALGYAH